MKMQKLTIFAMLIFGLHMMMLQGAAPKTNVFMQAEKDNVRAQYNNIKNIIIDFKDRVYSNRLFDEQEFHFWLDYIAQHKHVFATIINDDMYDDNGELVIEQGELLEEAIYHNNAQVVALLLAAGIDVNMKDSDGQTPLLLACQKKQAFNIVALLLAVKNIDVNLSDNNGVTPLHTSCGRGYEDIVRLLLTTPNIKVNITDHNGSTPLHVACYKGYKDIVKILLAIPHIDINIQDNYGFTPLYNACSLNHVNIVKLLLNAGADINLGDKGKTVADYATGSEMRALFAPIEINDKENNKENNQPTIFDSQLKKYVR